MTKAKLFIAFVALLVSLVIFTGCAEKCEHSYTEEILTSPTCTESGEKAYICSECGFSYSETVAALGHEYGDEWITDVEPTCATEGSKSHHCINCDDTTDVTSLPKNGVHNVVDGYCDRCNRKESSHGLEYKENPDGTYQVIGIGSCTDSEIVIDIFNNRDVVSIAAEAFQYSEQITGVEISDSVKEIGHDAFAYCTNLANLKLGSGVKVIDRVFYDCTSLTELVIPEGVTTIRDFSFCENLTRVVIPASLTTIHGNAYFQSSNKLEEIIVAEGNGAYKSIDGNLYTKDGARLLRYASAKAETAFTVPSSVIHIASEAFAHSKNITELIIPEGVVSIGNSCFLGCDNIVKLSIPSSIKSATAWGITSQVIELAEYDNAYYFGNGNEPYLILYRAKDKNITSCTINEQTKYIYSQAFERCESLTDVDIPDSVLYVGHFAFQYCSGLTSIAFSDSLLGLFVGAFGSCPNLTSVFIPKELEYVDFFAFSNCPKLTLYCEAESDPWDVWSWHDTDATVIFGATVEDFLAHGETGESK